MLIFQRYADPFVIRVAYLHSHHFSDQIKGRVFKPTSYIAHSGYLATKLGPGKQNKSLLDSIPTLSIPNFFRPPQETAEVEDGDTISDDDNETDCEEAFTGLLVHVS